MQTIVRTSLINTFGYLSTTGSLLYVNFMRSCMQSPLSVSERRVVGRGVDRGRAMPDDAHSFHAPRISSENDGHEQKKPCMSTIRPRSRIVAYVDDVPHLACTHVHCERRRTAQTDILFFSFLCFFFYIFASPAALSSNTQISRGLFRKKSFDHKGCSCTYNCVGSVALQIHFFSKMHILRPEPRRVPSSRK